MSDYFMFDGVDCRDYNILAFRNDTFGADAISYNVVSVPGRNGDLLINNNRYPNRQHVYDCVIYDDAEENYKAFREFIMSKVGYFRLEDTWDDDVFYSAYVSTSLAPVTTMDAGMIKFKLGFTRKPQRYLKTGETVTSLFYSGSINNPTLYASKPLLRVYGNGVLGIGSDSLTIRNNAREYIDIDCADGLAYRDVVNMNTSVILSGFDFPVLNPGSNNISIANGITRVDRPPRWW
jgi:phage-related protein